MSQHLCAVNQSKGVTLAPRIKVAASWIARCRGLLGTASLSSEEGLWLSPCRSVHTFFMRYPIDVLFIDAHGTVVSMSSLVPWRLSGWAPRAAGALELAAGSILRSHTAVGDRIELKNI